MASSSDNLFWSLLKFLISCAVLFLLMCRGMFVDASDAVYALNVAGYKDVTILDKSIIFTGWEGCDSADASAFLVQAKNPRDEKVKVLACIGWPFKGGTVRVPGR